jgi:UDP-glucose 4-epimerase
MVRRVIMNVVVTGGSGQLGSIVLRRLSADRSVRSIKSLDVRPPIVTSPKLSAVIADVRDPSIGRHFEGADAVIHLAFIVTQAASPDLMRAVNINGTKNVFRGALEAGVKTIVYTSSVAAYGVFPDHPVPIVETTPRRYQPSFTYSATKFEVEAFLDEIEPSHPDVAIARLRPAVLLGARMEHALGKAVAARLFPDVGGPPLPVVWDEDVADAAILALRQRARGAYNLSADEPISTRAFAEAAGLRYVPIPRAVLRGVARLPSRLTGIPAADPAWVDTPAANLVMSTAKAKAELGWKPRCPTTLDVARRVGETARGRLDPRLEVFFRLGALAAKRLPPRPEAASVSARIHLDISGRGGGDIGLLIDNGRMSVELGSIPRPPTSVISVKKSTLLDLLAGKASIASAQLTGKVRIEGEPIAGMALSSIIMTFRAQADAEGPRAWPVKRLSDWMSRSQQ